MYKLNDSKLGYSSDLAVFLIPPTDVSIRGVRYESFLPQSMPYKGQCTPLTFSIPASSMDYVCLKKSKLIIQGRIINTANNPIADEEVTLINNPLVS